MFAYLLTEVDNGRLTIQTRPNLDIDPTEPLNFFLTVKSIDKIEITSSGDVFIPELEVDSLEVKLSSSGNLDIAGGKVRTQKITISSSGHYAAQNMESDEAEIKISSSGGASIWVSNHLKANLSSSGGVSYLGQPTLDVSTSSSGEVHQIAK